MTADWIRDFRRSMGMSREAFARAVTYQLGGRGGDALTVTGALVGILEDRIEAVTHPRLADLIAAACGATRKQRDSIVHKKHRGTWPGVDGPRLIRGGQAAKRMEPTEHKGGNVRKVVVLDRTGSEVCRVDTISQAAAFIGISRSGVSQRCRHLIPFEWQTGCLYTARYADEWDAMSPEQRMLETRRTADGGPDFRKRSSTNVKKPVVMVDRQCRELGRWPSVADAVKGSRICTTSVRNRCARLVKREWTPQSPFTFRFAEEWDTMNDEQRRKDVGLYEGLGIRD